MPVLTLFLWEDGAWFDDIVNEYWGSDDPVAIDPFNPFKVRDGANGTVGRMNQTLGIVETNISSAVE